MKTKICLRIAVLLSVFCWQLSLAQVQFQPRVFIGVSDYDFTPSAELATDAQTFGGAETSDTMALAGLGATLIVDSWFVDAYMQKTDQGSFNGQDFVIDQGIGSTTFTDQNGEIDHSDVTFAIGRAFDAGVSLSLGYKFGETEVNETSLDVFRDFEFGTTETSDFSAKQVFKNEGPFISLGYGRAVGNGVIAANVAVADLDADYFLEEFTEDDPFSGQISGDATGVSLGAFWKASLTEHMSYKVSVDYYRYDFDFGFDPDFPGERAEAREEATTIKFEISMPLKLSYP
jgi:hypothetical protein